MSRNNFNSRRKPSLRRPALVAAIALGLSGQAFAIEFTWGDNLTGTFDTTVSYGVQVRVQEIDPNLIGKGNLLPTAFQLPNAQQRLLPGRFSVNSDDGNRKYEDGDVFSNAFKVTSELNLNWGDNWGAFMRASYFYDFENADRDDLTKLAKEKVGEDFKFLDAFVFHNFNLLDRDGTVRLGQQVVSWGESTFIQNGINVINPIDVSKLRVAGSELKEAFLPVNMIYGSWNLDENVSLEALYMFEFEQTEPEPAGTYFSANDFATLGGTYVMLGFGVVPQPVNNPELIYATCFNNGAGDTGLPIPIVRTGCGAAVVRAPDRYPSDSGQFGGALRIFAPGLNDTEFAFFYLNYHSRLPLISGITITNSSPTSGRYFVEYPEDIDLFGVSFNTTITSVGVALQGEVSYRPNAPLQIDDVEVLFAALSPLNPLLPAPSLRFSSQLGQFGPGQEIRGWDRFHVSQWQLTATKLFAEVLGADQIAAVAEFGGTYVDLPAQSQLRFQGDGTDTGGGGDILGGFARNPITQTNGFPTSYSWGYRLAFRGDYNSAFGSAFNLSPRLAFNHDVNGITPGPGGNFIEDRKSLTLGLEGTYLNAWAADISYTRFFGAADRDEPGDAALNLIHDRDFAAFTLRYSF